MSTRPIPLTDGISPTGSYRLPPWLYPPAEWDIVDDIGYVALPAVGAQATIITHQIEAGFNGIFTTYGNNFVGGGFQEGSGNVVWQVLRDGAAVPGLDNILGSLGSPASPTRHPAGFRVMENQVVTFVVKNVSIVVAGQLIGARWQGWLYPKEYEDPSFAGQ